jgi:uncharacterized phage-like protein YoqJ
MILGITGHRPQKLEGGFGNTMMREAIRTALVREFMRLRPESIITGMALGVDQWAAEVAIAHCIPFMAAIPFANQDKTWPEDARAKYRSLLCKANGTMIVSPGEYSIQSMHRRNAWIVEESNALLAVWDGSVGGTSACVALAEFKKLPITRIIPKDELEKLKTSKHMTVAKAAPIVVEPPDLETI